MEFIKDEDLNNRIFNRVMEHTLTWKEMAEDTKSFENEKAVFRLPIPIKFSDREYNSMALVRFNGITYPQLANLTDGNLEIVIQPSLRNEIMGELKEDIELYLGKIEDDMYKNKDMLDQIVDLLKDQKIEYKPNPEDGEDWTQNRSARFIGTILETCNILWREYKLAGDRLVVGESVANILATSGDLFKLDDSDGKLGLLNGVIKVYKASKELLNPDYAIVYVNTRDGRRAKLVEYVGLTDMLKSVETKW